MDGFAVGAVGRREGDSARRANLAVSGRRAESAFSADSARRANLAVFEKFEWATRPNGRGTPFFFEN